MAYQTMYTALHKFAESRQLVALLAFPIALDRLARFSRALPTFITPFAELAPRLGHLNNRSRVLAEAKARIHHGDQYLPARDGPGGPDGETPHRSQVPLPNPDSGIAAAVSVQNAEPHIDRAADRYFLQRMATKKRFDEGARVSRLFLGDQTKTLQIVTNLMSNVVTSTPGAFGRLYFGALLG